MSYSCDDNIVLFIGNPREGDLAVGLADNLLGIVCAYSEIWMIDLVNEYCLRGTWIPAAGVSRDAQENITETIPVGLIGGQTFVINEREKLDRFMQQANLWHRGEKRNNSIWLYHSFVGEGNIRRSLIYNITSRDDSVSYPSHNDEMAIDMQLRIERHFCWEDYSYSIQDAPAPFLLWGTTQNLGFAEGNVNSRIALLRFSDRIRNPAAPAKPILGNLWIGVKEDVGCGIDLWSPLWECETGTDRSGYANVNVADATASAGFYRSVNFFALPTAITTQITIPLNSAFSGLTRADYEQFRGDYIVLIRARLSNQNMVVPMTIRYGWLDGGRKNIVRQSPVIFTGEADWRLIEVGVISLPPDSGRQWLSLGALGQNNLGNYTIDILAGLDASGVIGSLHLDALYLIPYEHRATIRYEGQFSPSFATAPVISDSLYIATHEDDQTEVRYLVGDAVIGDSVDPVADYLINQNDFTIPYRDNRIVYAANSFKEVGGVYKNENDLTWLTNTSYRLYSRWLSYRASN